MKRYIHFLILAVFMVSLTGCREEDLFNPEGEIERVDGLPVEIEINVNDFNGTRGVSDESKKTFENGELIHIRAEYYCELEGRNYTILQYGVMKYGGRGSWSAFDANHTLTWPGEALYGNFTAYYLYGSTGVLTSNFMAPKLLSDYEYGQDPLYGEDLNVKYGHTIRFDMTHVFTHLTLTEMNPGVAEELWFTIPETSVADSPLNNAFYLDFNESNLTMTPVFTQVPSTTYFNESGEGLVYISSPSEQYDSDQGEVKTRASYFLQPGTYHQFSLLYPRSRTEAPVYLSYNRDLAAIVPDGFVANGLYEFSVLKSLGVEIDQTPDDSWDKSDPTVIVDVEAFLRAANSGSDYSEFDEETQQWVQILEQTPTGTRLLVNADFRYFPYTIFAPDNFAPSISNTFDGNYHYISHTGCPLFYENNGTITNLGFRDCKTEPLESNELYPVNGTTHNTSYNGLIASRNLGAVSNVRIINAEMTVLIRTSREEATQEAHNAALLFGVNYGNVYDIYFGGNLSLTLGNAIGETIIPQVVAGTITAQNFGTVSGVYSLDEDDIANPEIKIYNQCQGLNGVYLIGGISGNSTGSIYNVILESLVIDGSTSQGVECRIGGMVGELGLSYTGASHTEGCIVRGEVISGQINPVTNVASICYIGGVAGSINTQAIMTNCSASVGVTGSPNYSSLVSYGAGGAFGRIESTTGFIDGTIQTLACFGSKLSGQVNVGNFAGIAPVGYTWESKYANEGINVRQYAGRQNIASFM